MKQLLLVLLISLSSASAFSADKLVRECKSESGGLDTYSKSALKIFLDESGNQYGGYRVEYQYELGGMGGKQKINQNWGSLFCRLNTSRDFDCQQMSGNKSVQIVAKAGSLNVLEIDPASVNGVTIAEGASLVFDKPVGTCTNP